MTGILTPSAGTIGDIRREDDCGGDDGRGYERDEMDQFHRVVRQLVAVGDDRARAAGRRARRTLTEMAPGYARQPVLRLTRPLNFRAAGGACVLCGRWNCDGTCYAPAPASAVQRNSVMGVAR
ncbi:hypothetical protein AB0N06_30110 [Streptomyces sp. NPDC051020]|uniref:hypothetical protein n=1 Tax=Streptomyces sp. NPDC051020 TaxID=3155409 RepID=UPI003441D066